MTQTVIAFFDNASDAQNAVEKLTNNGFSRDNIDISLNTVNTEAATTNTESGNYKDTNESGVGRFFRSLFRDDSYEADKYARVAERGNSVVTVYAATTEEAQLAADILDSSGAIDVNERATEYGYTSGSGITSKETMDIRSGNVPTSIPVVEENVQIGKREVETGGVRLRSRIVETPVEENLRLREEHVRVERTPVDRPATDADLQNFQEREMTEHAEVPVVNKEARVVEEVNLNKEVEERDETVKETVRKTQVDVENLEGKTNKRQKK
jgi:stress response protein YsnF